VQTLRQSLTYQKFVSPYRRVSSYSISITNAVSLEIQTWRLVLAYLGFPRVTAFPRLNATTI